MVFLTFSFLDSTLSNPPKITDPGGLHPEDWTLRDTAVKRFRRSAADFKLDIPELVRPPEVLERVCGYLEEWVMVSIYFPIFSCCRLVIQLH